MQKRKDRSFAETSCYLVSENPGLAAVSSDRLPEKWDFVFISWDIVSES